jgi:transcriptional regulator with XRE-family HTH domain
MTNMSLQATFFSLHFVFMSQIRNEKLIKAIALVFKRVRDGLEISQDQVMNDLKIDKELSIHLGRIETAKSNPTISTIEALCSYYKISLSNFFKMVEKELLN